MATYYDVLTDQFNAPVPGAYVAVVTQSGTNAVLTGGDGAVITNPVTTGIDGSYLFTTDAGAYVLKVYYGGRLVQTTALELGGDPTPKPLAPLNATPPVATGNGAVGQILSVTNGTWANAPTAFSYQWQRGNVYITGATGYTYVLTNADASTSVSCVVRASNATGATTSTSNAIGVAAAATVPVNRTAPFITGTAQTGSTLTCSTGVWDNSPTGYTYQWFRGGTLINGSINSTRLLTANDVGFAMTCVVTATNGQGSGNATTAATTPVTGSSVAVPVNTALPVVSGTSNVGETLLVSNGTWTNNPTAYSYQWRRDGVDINGATRNNYVQLNADVGKVLTCRVTAANDGGGTPAVSNSSGPVPPAQLFSAQSPWNSYPENPTFGTNTVPDSKNTSWIEESAYSTKAFYAASTDGPVTVYGTDGGPTVDISNQLDKGTVTIPRFPTATSPAVGSDGHCEIVDLADGSVHSFYQMYQSNGQWRTAKYTKTTYSGRGFGTVSQPDNSRAAGTSTLGGLLLKDEMSLSIVPHAIAMGMDRNAFVSGPVYPATLEDYTGYNTYGNIAGHNFPMGSLLMIPPGFNVDALVLPESKTIARTMMKYGGYLVDATVDTMNFYAEIGSGWNKSYVNGQYNSSFGSDMLAIKNAIRRVTGFSAMRDRNGVAYTPLQLRNMNLISMRGPWEVQYGSFSTGEFSALTDFFEMPQTTAFSSMRQLLYTHSDTQADRFFEWKKQGWNINPEPGATYTFKAVGSGNLIVELNVKKSDYSQNYGGSGKLAPGGTKTFVWPNDTGTVTEIYVEKDPGDEAQIRLEMVKVVA